MADCISGAFLVYAERRAYIDTVQTGDDLKDLFNGLFNIGDRLGDRQSHGTIDQRIRAFFIGYNSPNRGAWNCDFYYTDGVSIVPLGTDTGDQGPATTTPGPSTTVSSTVTTVATPTGTGTVTTLAEPQTLPAATSALPTGSTDAGLNGLAQQCLDGDMGACDSLYNSTIENSHIIVGLEDYSVFGDTCAGRQPEDTGFACEDVFISAGATATTVAAPVTTVAAPVTTVAAAVTTTVAAPVTTVVAAPVTTVSAATVTTVSVSGAALTSQAALDYCATSVVPGEFADREADEVAAEDIGAIAAEASTNGQTQDQLVTQLVQDSWGANANKVIIANPFDGRTDTTKANALGEVVGLTLICMANVLEMPQDVIDNYTSTDSGQDTWPDSTGTLTYEMDWGLQDNPNTGVKDFVVFIYDALA